LREHRGGDAGRLSQPPARRFPAAPAGLLPGVLEPGVQSQGHARITRPRLRRAGADRVLDAPARRRGGEGHLDLPRLPFAIALLAIGLMYLLGLGSAPFLDPPEGFHAALAESVRTSGDWATLRANGVRYFDKPPLL